MLIAYEKRELRALAYKVVVEPEEEPKRAITLIREREDAFRIGRVLSVGSIAREKVPDLRVGDRVLYAQSTACTTAVKNRHIVHHDHVICALADDVCSADLDARAPAP